MKNIYLVTSRRQACDSNWHLQSYNFLKNSAKNSNRQIVEDPNIADLILFADSGDGPYLESIRRHYLYKAHHKKCCVFSTDDHIVPLLPGLYASLASKYYDPSWSRTGFYLNSNWISSRFHKVEKPTDPRYLFSFSGSIVNHMVRQRIFELFGNATYAKIIDVSGQVISAFSSGDNSKISELERIQTELTRDSLFVLCPRGSGLGSIRLFETMKMGRVPVIISDGWQPLDGIDWDSFSLRVAEKDVHLIPGLLERFRRRAYDMCRVANEVWEAKFSDRTAFDTIIDQFEMIFQSGRRVSRLNAILKWRFLLADPFHLRNYLRQKIARHCRIT